jgi:excisionase family DNA binding protein
MSMLTISEATRELKISRSSFYRILERGNGPRTVKVGGQVRIPAEEFVDWIGRLQHGSNLRKSRQVTGEVATAA